MKKLLLAFAVIVGSAFFLLNHRSLARTKPPSHRISGGRELGCLPPKKRRVHGLRAIKSH